MRIPRWLSICICSLLVWSFPLLTSGQTLVYQFQATDELPDHAPKLLHSVVTDAAPGSLVSFEDDHVKLRVRVGLSEAYLLEVLQSAGLGPFTPMAKPAKVMDRESPDPPASGSGTAPPGGATTLAPTDH